MIACPSSPAAAAAAAGGRNWHHNPQHLQQQLQNELSLELIPQLSINLTMLLLSITKYPVESGLQSIFQDKKETSNPSFWIVQLGLQEFAKTIDESEKCHHRVLYIQCHLVIEVLCQDLCNDQVCRG